MGNREAATLWSSLFRSLTPYSRRLKTVWKLGLLLMDYNTTEPLVDLLAAIGRSDDQGIIDVLRTSVKGQTAAPILLRTAINYSSADTRFYRKVYNLWERAGKPPLKSTVTEITVELLSDGTVDGLAPYLEMFLAAGGIRATIEVGPFDAVEIEAFSGKAKDNDLTIVALSGGWLRKRIRRLPVEEADLAELLRSLEELARALVNKRSGLVAFTSFHYDAWPTVSSMTKIGGALPWGAVISKANDALLRIDVPSLAVIDAQQAIHMAGGAFSCGSVSLMRMRSHLEECGLVALAKEAASAAAHSFGRSHRALLTDWDNTLWGGEVGEVGSTGVELGPETPDGYGFQLLQAYIQDLAHLGVAVAAISRNDPNAASILEENSHMRLQREHFATLELSWGDKSESVDRIVRALNFGADLMVYLDDNHVDLAEVASRFPDIDVVLAGPNPDDTLYRLSRPRFFNSMRLTEDDLNRHSQFVALREQRELLGASSSKEAFLASLSIEIGVSPINPQNEERVLQLLTKTNQFNLTTRRHTQGDLRRLREGGAQFGVFDYRDRYGSQGVIGLMIVVPAGADFEIDTWLMSCRVLNRDVEKVMLDWAKRVVGHGRIIGRYLPTAKNSLVSGLYPSLGFRDLANGLYELDVSSE